MKARPFRGLAFAHPDFDVGEAASGLTLSPTGAIGTVEAEACVRQAVLLILTTSLGERVMRPDYGCGLNQVAFWANDDTTAGVATHFVRQALERWEPRIEILSIEADKDESQPSQLNVWLVYRVRATGLVDRLLFYLDLMSPEE